MERITVPRPNIDDVIMVTHENRGPVPMKVFSFNNRNRNLLECEFEGIEVCVRLGKVFDGNEWLPRWESITD
jgi:hypothetical protein